MKFLADENIAREIVEELRRAGHEVEYTVDWNRGAADDDVLTQAGNEQAIVLTADRDFGEMIFRKGCANRGVVFLRLFGLSQTVKARVILDTVRQCGSELANNFTVVSPGGIRIRKSF